MPIYHYYCSNCEKTLEIKLSISEYLNYKKELHYCQDCQGVLKQKIFPTYSKIDRDKEYIIQNAKEEAKVVVEKMNQGHEKTIIEMCGDKER